MSDQCPRQGALARDLPLDLVRLVVQRRVVEEDVRHARRVVVLLTDEADVDDRIDLEAGVGIVSANQFVRTWSAKTAILWRTTARLLSPSAPERAHSAGFTTSAVEVASQSSSRSPSAEAGSRRIWP